MKRVKALLKKKPGESSGERGQKSQSWESSEAVQRDAAATDGRESQASDTQAESKENMRFETQPATPKVVPENKNSDSTGDAMREAIDDLASQQAIETVHANPRCEAARHRLIKASHALVESLKIYEAGRKGEDFPSVYLSTEFRRLEVNGPVTPEQLTAAVDDVLTLQNNQESKVTTKFGNFIAKIYPLASLALGIGAAAADGATFAPVKGAANGLCLLLSIANQEHTRAADFMRQLDRISFQALRVDEIQKRNSVEVNDLLLEKSIDLMSSILVFFEGSIRFFRHGYFFNLGKSIVMGPKVYADAKSGLDSAINEYDQALLLQATIKLFELGQSVPVATDITQPKLSELVSWLKPSTWEVGEELSKNCQNRAPGTLEWVLIADEFKNWRLSSKVSRDSRALWLNGLPGVGKSTIAAYVTEILQAQHKDAVALHFFCKTGNPALSSPIKLIRTLAAQLAISIPGARNTLQALKDDNFTDSDSVLYMLQQLVRKALTGIDQDVFIIIDGLDECETSTTKDKDEAIEILIEGLLNLDVKLLISSRPTPEIARALESKSVKKRAFTYEDSKDDIQSYISTCVSKSKILQKGFLSLGKDPSEFLAEKSQGNFLWVKIVLDILKKKSSTKDFQEVITTTPKDLEQLYDQLLTKLELAGDLEMALTILKCILFSERPLTLDEITAAVGLLFEEVLDLTEFVEANCGSFLQVIQGPKSGLYIGHETFRAYITTPNLSNERRLLPATSHAQLAAACLDCIILSNGTENLCFLDYALWRWLDHLDSFVTATDNATEADIAALLVKIHNLFSSPELLQSWLRQFCLQPKQKYEIGMRVANAHDLVLGFLLRSEMIAKLDKAEASASTEVQNALSWRNVMITSRVLASDVYHGFARVWISTNWLELEAAEYITNGVFAVNNLLQPDAEGASYPRVPDWRKDANQPNAKQRWQFHYGNSGHDLRTLDEVKSLTTFAGYNPHVGVETGNFAIAEALANSETCTAHFQEAIDANPECWHLHEGLAKYYKNNNENDKAIACFADALKVDTKEFKSGLLEHAMLVSKLNEENGNKDAAIEVLRTAAAGAPDKEAYRYWDTIAKIHEKTGDGNAMVKAYREAIIQHPRVQNEFWKKVGETLGRGGARQMEFQAYAEAMKDDPENLSEYGAKIRTLAGEMKDVCMWQPVAYILNHAVKADPTNSAEYYKQLGESYMCQRKWKQALEQFELYTTATTSEWIYIDIGHAFLGLGETAKAIAAYEHAIDKESHGALARNVGYVHIIDQNYTKAISMIKFALGDAANGKDSHPGHSFMQEVDDSRALRHFELYKNLGLCYEALGRLSDANSSFKSAIECLKPILDEQDAEKDRSTVYRHEARSLFELGLVQEKLGSRSEAKMSLERAVFLFEKTTFDTDDEVQTSEAEEAEAALSRLADAPSLLSNKDGADDGDKTSAKQESGQSGSPQNNKETTRAGTVLELEATFDKLANPPIDTAAQKASPAIPDLKGTLNSMRLHRRLALNYTTDWYAYQDWKVPRRRGAREWNKVSFVNKFKISNGDRTFISPWGFDHHDQD